MINQMMFNLFAVVTLMVPINIASLLWNDSDTPDAPTEETNQTLTRFESTIYELAQILAEDTNGATEEKPVTTQDTAQAAAPVETPEEDWTDALADWKADFPVYEEETAQAEFIQTIAPAAVLIAHQQGIYPSVMIAQAALESSWGQSGLAQSYNNLMGTKGNTEGKSVVVKTREDQDGESVYIDAGFTIYDSWAHSLSHYGSLMKNGLSWDTEYYSGTWRENTESYKDATAWLQGRYASDTAYATKLNQTIESFNLTQYDEMEPFEYELEAALEIVSEEL